MILGREGNQTKEEIQAIRNLSKQIEMKDAEMKRQNDEITKLNEAIKRQNDEIPKELDELSAKSARCPAGKMRKCDRQTDSQTARERKWDRE